MAKLGEGDKRWIVEERDDGTNVHNWHWAEKDAVEWSKQRLTELLGNLKIVKGKGSCWVKTTNSVSVEGEAYVNIRKGKIIPGYELHVKVNWEGEIRDISGERVLAKSRGFVEFPYIADENAGEDPEIKFITSDSGPGSERLKEALRAEGKSVLLNHIKTFVKEMAQGGPVKDALSGKKPTTSSQSSQKEAPKKVEKASKSPVSKVKKGFQTVKISQKFLCKKEDLFDVLINEKRWMAFSQSKATITPSVGGKFSVFGGSVTGEFVEIDSPVKLVQKWRFSSWEDGIFSTVQSISCSSLQ